MTLALLSVIIFTPYPARAGPPSFFNPLEILFYAIDIGEPLGDLVRRTGKLGVSLTPYPYLKDTYGAEWISQNPLDDSDANKFFLKAELFIEVKENKVICLFYNFSRNDLPTVPVRGDPTRCQSYKEYIGSLY